MTPLRTTLALLLVLAVVLLAAGCMEHPEIPLNLVEKKDLNTTGNTTYWIKINHIGSRDIGSRFSIIGTTNLPAGEEILCEISSPSADFSLKNASTAMTKIHVTGGRSGKNATLLYIDSAELVPDEYLHGNRSDTIRLALIERAARGDARDNLSIVLEKKHNYVSLDPIADKQHGDTFVITGTTSFPAGNEMELVISSLINGSSMIKGNVTVMEGRNGINTTLIPVDTSLFPVVDYDKYMVSEDYRNGGTYVFATTGFKTSAIPESPFFIRISPCPEFELVDPYYILHTADTCTFTGVTNLSAGDDVTWEIRPIPAAGLSVFGERAVINGTMGVTRGEAGLNQTLFTVNATVFDGCGGFLITADSIKQDGHGYDLLFIIPIVYVD